MESELYPKFAATREYELVAVHLRSKLASEAGSPKTPIMKRSSSGSAQQEPPSPTKQRTSFKRTISGVDILLGGA